MTHRDFQFRSKPNFFFYLGWVFVVLVLAFSLYNFIGNVLTTGGFLFINAAAIVITYFFGFRFSARIRITGNALDIRYYFRDGKHIKLPVSEIVAFDKHDDSVHRHFQKLFLVTQRGTFLIRYNISENSDEKMLQHLKKIMQQNKLHEERV